MNPFMVRTGLAAMLTALMFAGGCCISADSLFKATHQKTESVHLPAAGIRTLDIETRVGSITVNGSDVDEVHLSADIIVKAYSPEKAEELAEAVKIQIEPDGETLRIRASLPDDTKKRSVTVNFEVSAPFDLTARCRSTVGSVNINDMHGRIDAETDVGSITCKGVVAQVKLRANVGSVKVFCASDAPAGFNADIATNVGSIELMAPKDLSAEVSAATNVGSVSTTRPITVVGKLGKSMNGAIGGGDGKITLRTNVGSIEIR